MSANLSRRNFLKVASAAAGGITLGNLLVACGAEPTPTLSTSTTTAATSVAPTTAPVAPVVTTPVPSLQPTTAAAPAATPTVPAAAQVKTKFPTGFIWGSATAAYQVEGAAKEDGRGESIWDRFSHTPGKVKNGDTGDVADDHYHRYEQDLDLMKDLGLQAYRFSVAWPRIFPTGSGPVNQKGLDFYKRLAEATLKRNIRPMATLYHWDLPQALEDKGGWVSRDTAQRFAEYADTVFRALGDQITTWITHNEPWVVAYVGYGWGSHAPGLRDFKKAVQVTHNVLLSHGLAVQALRATNAKNSQVGITLNLSPMYGIKDTPEDKAAAQRYDGFQNRWFLDPVLKGAYPADMLPYYEKKYGPLDYIKPEDLKIINAPTDFLGINYYNPTRVSANPYNSFFELDTRSGSGPLTAMGWEISPNSLYDLLVRLKQDYGNMPLYITENGAAFSDLVEGNDQVNDAPRLQFLQVHFEAAQRAIEAGVNLKGYFVWSLMDNFEWAEGYSKRFGIVYVDYATQRRIPKRSALWYRDVIRQNGLGDLPPDIQQNGFKLPTPSH